MIFPLKPWNLLRPFFIGIFQLATFDYRVRMVSNFWHLLEVSRPWGNSKHGGFCTAIGYTGTNHIDTTNYMYNISQYISIYTYNYITLYLTLFKTIKKNKSKHMWISIFIQQLKYIYIYILYYIYLLKLFWWCFVFVQVSWAAWHCVLGWTSPSAAHRIVTHDAFCSNDGWRTGSVDVLEKTWYLYVRQNPM